MPPALGLGAEILWAWTHRLVFPRHFERSPPDLKYPGIAWNCSKATLSPSSFPLCLPFPRCILVSTSTRWQWQSKHSFLLPFLIIQKTFLQTNRKQNLAPCGKTIPGAKSHPLQQRVGIPQCYDLSGPKCPGWKSQAARHRRWDASSWLCCTSQVACSLQVQSKIVPSSSEGPWGQGVISARSHLES